MKSKTRLLPITSCYQCHLRAAMTCICHETGKKHPPPGSIPKWCPLEPNKPTTIEKIDRICDVALRVMIVVAIIVLGVFYAWLLREALVSNLYKPARDTPNTRSLAEPVRLRLERLVIGRTARRDRT